MSFIQTVRCPNCGSFAERLYSNLPSQVRTQCSTCDYSMTMSQDGNHIFEAYYPGVTSEHLCHKQVQSRRFLEQSSNISRMRSLSILPAAVSANC